MPVSKRVPLEVWKFGGASLADADAFRRAADLIREHSGPLVIVASAMFGITDLLLDGARRAVEGDVAAGDDVAREFLKRHAAWSSSATPRRTGANRGARRDRDDGGRVP